MKARNAIKGWIHALVRTLASVNRALAAGLLGALVIYMILYLVDTTEEPRLDIMILASITTWFLLIILHLFYDRRLSDWDSTAVGILFLMICCLSFFGYFWYQRSVRRLTSGEQQAWLDVVRTSAIIFLPAITIAVGTYYWHKWKGQEAIRPGDTVLRENGNHEV